MNKDFGFMQEVAPMKLIPTQLIERCRNEHDAFLLCWHKRTIKYSQAAAAGILGIPPSHFSNILSGKKYPSWDLRTKLQGLCNNWAIRQYTDLMEGVNSFETPEQRKIRQLEQDLEQARRAA
jgi:hypothetical protein